MAWNRACVRAGREKLGPKKGLQSGMVNREGMVVFVAEGLLKPEGRCACMVCVAKHVFEKETGQWLESRWMMCAMKVVQPCHQWSRVVLCEKTPWVVQVQDVVLCKVTKTTLIVKGVKRNLLRAMTTLWLECVVGFHSSQCGYIICPAKFFEVTSSKINILLFSFIPIISRSCFINKKC